MAIYRYQATQVGYWRGEAKRWTTTYYYSHPDASSSLKSVINKLGYKAPNDAVGACSGGLASIDVYSPSGGPPIDSNEYFDWANPGEWIPFYGSVWSSLTATPTPDASGESAMLVTGRLPGLSASGKPVYTRKYIHAIPSRSATDPTDPDIPAAVISAVESTPSLGSFMQSPSGVSPSSVTVEPYYYNHQRVRGRRRSVAQQQAQAFSGGVVAGAGAASGGQPFQG